jgi:hypothetical protein
MHDRQELRLVEYVHVAFHPRGRGTGNRHDLDGNAGDLRAGLIIDDVSRRENLIEVDARKWFVLVGC